MTVSAFVLTNTFSFATPMETASHVLDHSADDLEQACARAQEILSADVGAEFKFDKTSASYPSLTFAQACGEILKSGGGFKKIYTLVNHLEDECGAFIESTHPGYGIHDCKVRVSHALGVLEGMELLAKSKNCSFHPQSDSQKASTSKESKRFPSAAN